MPFPTSPCLRERLSPEDAQSKFSDVLAEAWQMPQQPFYKCRAVSELPPAIRRALRGRSFTFRSSGPDFSTSRLRHQWNRTVLLDVASSREPGGIGSRVYIREVPIEIFTGRRLTLQPVVGDKHQYSAVLEIELNVRNPYEKVISH